MNPSEELLPYSAAQQQNRMLLQGDDLDDDYDNGFYRKNGGGGGGYRDQPSLMMRSQKPLIEEEMPAPESQPYLMRRPQANAARQIYDRNQAAKSPWKKGMPYSQATLDTFDTSTPYEKKMFGGIQNPRQAATLAANRPGGFQKLFGAKMSADEKATRELAGRAPKKTFWQRLKHAVTGGGRKRSWMEMFFGARRRGQGTSAASMGITSTNAPNGVSSGWADQLIDASKAGRLDAPGDAKSAFISNQPLVAQSQDQHQSAQHYDADASIEEEEKQPGGINIFQKQLAQQQLLQNAHMSNEYGGGQKNEYGDGETVDDNSVDNENDNDLGNGAGGGIFANNGYDKSMIDAYMNNNNDDVSEDDDDNGEPDTSSFVRNFVMDQLRQKQ